MSVRLNVPLVFQKLRMSCWYASACMVAYYREAGPRLGVPERWIENKGLVASEFIRLAQAEGLKSIKRPQSALTAQHLEVFLRNYGPIWCAGRWDGLGHIVVLTGVDGRKVYINDPNPRKGRREQSLVWFNQNLWNKVEGCMMYMPE